METTDTVFIVKKEAWTGRSTIQPTRRSALPVLSATVNFEF
jgi:hypothetical protein